MIFKNLPTQLIPLLLLLAFAHTASADFKWTQKFPSLTILPGERSVYDLKTYGKSSDWNNIYFQCDQPNIFIFTENCSKVSDYTLRDPAAPDVASIFKTLTYDRFPYTPRTPSANNEISPHSSIPDYLYGIDQTEITFAAIDKNTGIMLDHIIVKLNGDYEPWAVTHTLDSDGYLDSWWIGGNLKSDGGLAIFQGPSDFSAMDSWYRLPKEVVFKPTQNPLKFGYVETDFGNQWFIYENCADRVYGNCKNLDLIYFFDVAVQSGEGLATFKGAFHMPQLWKSELGSAAIIKVVPYKNSISIHAKSCMEIP